MRKCTELYAECRRLHLENACPQRILESIWRCARELTRRLTKEIFNADSSRKKVLNQKILGLSTVYRNFHKESPYQRWKWFLARALVSWPFGESPATVRTHSALPDTSRIVRIFSSQPFQYTSILSPATSLRVHTRERKRVRE